MKEAFIAWNPRPSSRKMIAQANEILAEYAKIGVTMTLRGLHYQFVARGLFENTKKNYDRLGDTLSHGRLAGMVDWDYMEDRVRALASIPTWASRKEIMGDVPKWFRINPWLKQEYRPEVWVEKDALLGTIEIVCNELRVDHFACRGYVSQSAQYQASKRFQSYLALGQTPIIFHLGDHDPSGIDMTRENREKFELLTGEEIEVRRLALNLDQVKKHKPPPNFAKVKDPRFGGYRRKFGTKSWELDALEPRVLHDLIRKAITPLIDKKAWEKSMKEEETHRKRLTLIHSRWDEVEKLMDKKPPRKPRKVKKKAKRTKR